MGISTCEGTTGYRKHSKHHAKEDKPGFIPRRSTKAHHACAYYTAVVGPSKQSSKLPHWDARGHERRGRAPHNGVGAIMEGRSHVLGGRGRARRIDRHPADGIAGLSGHGDHPRAPRCPSRR